jgi:hypothetical protein
MDGWMDGALVTKIVQVSKRWDSSEFLLCNLDRKICTALEFFVIFSSHATLQSQWMAARERTTTSIGQQRPYLSAFEVSGKFIRYSTHTTILQLNTHSRVK